MARILWSGIGPWHRTAYGLLTAEFAYRIRDLGHEVVIAVMGRPERHGEAKGAEEVEAAQAGGFTFAHPDSRETKRTGLWDGMRVIGPGTREFGLPPARVVRAAFGGHDPDLIIVLKDPWVLYLDAYDEWGCPVLVWANVDCDPIGQPDLEFFRQSDTIPVAVSKFGLSTMRKHGLKNARYVPHGIDTSYWTPGDQGAARDLAGLPRGVFIAGINAANIGPRKAWGEQFAAFASEVRRGRRDSLLLVHAAPEHPEGFNLRHIAYFHGLNASPDRPRDDDHVRFGSNYNMRSNQMRNWYRSLDVLMACSYGEGFGVPLIEAQACGTPVICTDGSAMSELCGAGWVVSSTPDWEDGHCAWWRRPDAEDIEQAYEAAWQAREDGTTPALKKAARDFGELFDIDRVFQQYMAPVLKELEDRIS